MYMPALTLVILGGVLFVVGMLFAWRERKQHREQERRPT